MHLKVLVNEWKQGIVHWRHRQHHLLFPRDKYHIPIKSEVEGVKICIRLMARFPCPLVISILLFDRILWLGIHHLQIGQYRTGIDIK